MSNFRFVILGLSILPANKTFLQFFSLIKSRILPNLPILIKLQLISFLKTLFLVKSIRKYLIFFFLVLLIFFLENLCCQEITQSFYLNNGVQIGRFLSLFINSTISFTKKLLLKDPFKFFKLSFKLLDLKILL